MALRTQEQLEAIMAGHALTQADLDALMHDKVKEDSFLEYKHGNEIRDSKKGSATIRQYVSGFANSEGGVLIIGLDAEVSVWNVTGAKAPGGHDLARWASDCLADMMASFSPLPRFQVVAHPHGNVLVIAVGRAPNLVACVEARTIVYYLRLYDKTLRAPEYLLSDLMLGRRQHPHLHITDVMLESISKYQARDEDALNLQFGPVFMLENQSLSWAENVIVGCIGYGKQRIEASKPVGSSLLAYVDVQEVDSSLYPSNTFLTHHSVRNIPLMQAFGVQRIALSAIYVLPFRIYRSWFTYTWKAAVYVVSKNAPPLWYQLSLKIHDPLVKFADSGRDRITLADGFLTCEWTVDERPVVGWSDLHTYT